MDLPGNINEYVCVCGKTISSHPGSMTLHQSKCKRSKSRLAGALEKAQAILKRRKQRRTDSVEATTGVENCDLNLNRIDGVELECKTVVNATNTEVCCIASHHLLS